MFEEYAHEHGCRLIIDPSSTLKGYEMEVRRIRLNTLLDFLKDSQIKNVQLGMREWRAYFPW